MNKRAKSPFGIDEHGIWTKVKFLYEDKSILDEEGYIALSTTPTSGEILA